ncbi:MAG TPA: PDZ domain-containing protein [Candidatus Polarisedimenticolaceae bacterium]|nr:PDZ domain-containing protein [Candidatus Polarisedimenticolaceae bacterium]
MTRFLAALGCLSLATSASLAGEPFNCKATAQDCLESMSAKLKNSGWVGIEFQEDSYTITKVIPGSPAAQAGLQPGDVLYALNGVPLLPQNKEALAKVRKEWKPGQCVAYTVQRSGADREVRLTLAPMPADVMASWIGEHMRQHAEHERAAVATVK